MKLNYPIIATLMLGGFALVNIAVIWHSTPKRTGSGEGGFFIQEEAAFDDFNLLHVADLSMRLASITEPSLCKRAPSKGSSPPSQPRTGAEHQAFSMQ